METILRVFSSNASTVHEDAMQVRWRWGLRLPHPCVLTIQAAMESALPVLRLASPSLGLWNLCTP